MRPTRRPEQGFRCTWSILPRSKHKYHRGKTRHCVSADIPRARSGPSAGRAAQRPPGRAEANPEDGGAGAERVAAPPTGRGRRGPGGAAAPARLDASQSLRLWGQAELRGRAGPGPGALPVLLPLENPWARRLTTPVSSCPGKARGHTWGVASSATWHWGRLAPCDGGELSCRPAPLRAPALSPRKAQPAG